MKKASAYGFSVPQLLLPAENVDLYKWACVACDQFTSQPEYWRDVAKIVGTSPSTLHMMLPEVYLESEDVQGRIAALKETMERYTGDGTLEPFVPGIMLTLRHIRGKARKGILLAMDLEQYDFRKGSRPLIRATEQTVLSRIPPRVQIRKGAPLEMPHIMLMIDDPGDGVIGPLYMQRDSFDKIYEVDLMQGGGLLEGWHIRSEKIIDGVIDAFSGLEKRGGMLFCVGDGNHSLATAKTIYEQAKADIGEQEARRSPLRYALCEVINLRDRAVEFMPIHRVLFGVNPASCADFIADRLRERGRQVRLVFGRFSENTQSDDGSYIIPFLYKDGAGKLLIENPSHPLAVGEVQEIFEEYVQAHKNSSIDYIHGDEAFKGLSAKYDCIGFYFDALKKSEFFDLVIKCGVLPKKTFSLGEAEEKRYYMECRRLKEQAEEGVEYAD